MTETQKLLAEKLLLFMQQHNHIVNEDDDELDELFNSTDRKISECLQLLEQDEYLTSNDNTHTLTEKGKAFKSFANEEKKKRKEKWTDWPERNWYISKPVFFIMATVATALITIYITEYLKSPQPKNKHPEKTSTRSLNEDSHLPISDSLEKDSSSIKPTTTDSTPKGQ